MQKCPICGGTIGNGVCLSCGYVIPDEDAIAAPYNYDPDDYAQQEDVHDKNEPSEWAEMDPIGVPSSESIGQALAKKPSLDNAAGNNYAAANNRTAVKKAPPPPVHTQTAQPREEPWEPPREEPQDVFSIFVQGFVTEVKRHWWKALLILLVPVSAIFMGIFYFWKGGGCRRYRFGPVNPERLDFKAFGLGVLYMAIGFGLILSDWDPFGLSTFILSIFGD